MTEKKISRRDAMKILGAAIGAAALANLPSKWDKPELAQGVLPAHAQQSVAVAAPVCLAAVGNVALKKMANQSSTEGAGFEAIKAVDGSVFSRWASSHIGGAKNPEWIYVDLDDNYNISRVTIRWEAAYAESYQVEVSNDAVNWNAVANVVGGKGGVVDHAFATGCWRYVRVYCTLRTGLNDGFSLYEIEVYG